MNPYEPPESADEPPDGNDVPWHFLWYVSAVAFYVGAALHVSVDNHAAAGTCLMIAFVLLIPGLSKSAGIWNAKRDT